jgi:hypothetical protein
MTGWLAQALLLAQALGARSAPQEADGAGHSELRGEELFKQGARKASQRKRQAGSIGV